MRILHMDAGREMRGGQHQVLFLLRALRGLGVDQALCAPPDAPLRQLAAGEGFSVTATARRGEWDIYHAHDAHSHTRAVMQRLHPLIVSRRVAFPVKTGLLSRWKYARADAYLAVSKFAEARLRAAGIPAEIIHVVYDAAPPLPAASGDRVIAPATDDPRKGSALAREAARLAGVELHFSRDLPADLASSRLLVYLSYEEGLGSAALLAHSAGVPVLASRVGGLQEVVEHGVSGALVANDPAAVADALLALLGRDAAALAQMRAAAHRNWQARFTIEIMASATHKVYASLVGQKAS
ncbi:MAG: glycosyltransferase [Bryobacterales bacterium]|nr:glycosyltransferase [Bryobacterales bacterium]